MARPLDVLSPLIKQDIEAGDAAMIPLGELLLEVQSRLGPWKFVRWFEKQHFPSWAGRDEVQRWMALAADRKK